MGEEARGGPDGALQDGRLRLPLLCGGCSERDGLRWGVLPLWGRQELAQADPDRQATTRHDLGSAIGSDTAGAGLHSRTTRVTLCGVGAPSSTQRFFDRTLFAQPSVSPTQRLLGSLLRRRRRARRRRRPRHAPRTLPSRPFSAARPASPTGGAEPRDELSQHLGGFFHVRKIARLDFAH